MVETTLARRRGMQTTVPRHTLSGNYIRSLSLCFFCLFSSSGTAAETVQALRYGVTLFHFFQQDYFSALTELMVAQQLQQLDVHADNAELLRAGMSLSYGMDRVAEQIFVAMLTQPQAGQEDSLSSTVDRDKAWFYLAKLAWQRGSLERTSDALAQMSADYGGPVAVEANYLRAALRLRQGEETVADEQALRLPVNSPWRYYHYYNRGAALAARGQWNTAAQYFGHFSDIPFRSAEGKQLRDKALTAAGYAQMSSGNWQKAAADFTRVRLDSPQSERALLGYGWSFAEQGDYVGALAPWQLLSERPPISESVRASLLAIPYAYEQLGKLGLALASYQGAVATYEQELDAIDKAIEVFRDGDLKPVLGLDDYQSSAWITGTDLLPDGEQAPYLMHLVSKHSFQLAVRELQDLHSIATHLSKAGERLAVLSQVDEDQQRSWATVLEGDRLTRLTQRRQDLRTRLDTLQGAHEAAEAEQDSRWFASAEQRSRWQRLGRAAGLVGELGLAEQHDHRLALYRGLLLWDDNEQFPARRWQIKRQLRQLEALAEESVAGVTAAEAASEHAGQASFMPRITRLEQRTEAQSTRTVAAIDHATSNLRQVAVSELTSQRTALTRALGRSRLAIARLYDVASTGALQ